MGEEIASDITNRRFVLIGGGALLKNMDAVLRDAMGLPVQLADNPRRCVVIGASRMLATVEWR